MYLLDQIRSKHDIWYKVFLFLISVFLIVYFFPKEASFKYEFQKNKPWYYDDLIAPYDIPVYPTAQEIEAKKEKIQQNQKLYFTLNDSILAFQIKRFNKLLDNEWEAFFKSYKKANTNWFKKLRNSEESLKKEIKEQAQQTLSKIYAKGIVQSNNHKKLSQDSIFYVKKEKYYAAYSLRDVLTLKQSYQYIANQFDVKDMKEGLLLNLLSFLMDEKAPNIIFSPKETEKALQKELNIANAVIENLVKGQSIIKRGDIVDEYKFRILKSYEKKYKSEKISTSKSFVIIAGQLLLVSLIIFCLALYLYFFRLPLFEDNKSLFFLLLCITSAVVFCSIILHYNLSSVYIFPLCLVPLVIRSFFDTRTAFFCHLIIVLLLGFIMPNGFNFMFMQLIAGMIGIYGFANFMNRSQLFYTTIAILCAYFISHVALSMITEGAFNKIDWLTFGWLSIAAGLTLLAYPIIYVLEKLFGFISDVTLLELADTNNPLLRELSRKAPGTLQHSLQVANLAEEAIRLIEGNALLIRTAALYHDIGKMRAPMYFIENQQTGINPHDELNYEESARIIIDHVRDGVALAKKHKLPETIIDFIRTHHGTSNTGYFFNKYMEEHPDDEDAVSLFQYPGPIPFSKETAVLMMADSVEAASRSIKNPNVDKIDALVEGIIDKQMQEHQFDNANITFKDITKIKKVFKRILMNIYHVRIEYPK